MGEQIYFASGVDRTALREALQRGFDAAENRIEPFPAPDDGWTMRCCLRNSQPGELIAVVSWSPFPWEGPYREVGPVVVHTDECEGFKPSPDLPSLIDDRPMELRPYGYDKAIVYPHVIYVSKAESVAKQTRLVLSHSEVDFVHGRNVHGGCFAFVAHRQD